MGPQLGGNDGDLAHRRDSGAPAQLGAQRLEQQLAGVRHAATDDLSVQTVPALVAAERLYGSLADADATASRTFLEAGLEPKDLRRRYHRDLERAVAAGVGDRVRFEVASAKTFPGTYDLVAFFDCLHDMGDPVSVSRHAREAISDDGTAMLVEPFANDRMQDNLNPVGRVMYGASTQICVPVSLARNGPALGAQAGEARLREVVVDGGGFTRFRRATETPLNLVLEARP